MNVTNLYIDYPKIPMARKISLKFETFTIQYLERRAITLVRIKTSILRIKKARTRLNKVKEKLPDKHSRPGRRNSEKGRTKTKNNMTISMNRSNSLTLVQLASTVTCEKKRKADV